MDNGRHLDATQPIRGGGGSDGVNAGVGAWGGDGSEGKDRGVRADGVGGSDAHHTDAIRGVADVGTHEASSHAAVSESALDFLCVLASKRSGAPQNSKP